MMSNRMIIAFIIIGIAIIAGIIGFSLIKEVPIHGNLTGLKKFSSIDEIRMYLREQETVYRPYYGPNYIQITDGAMRVPVPGAPVSKAEIGLPSINRAAEYSTTNIQVAGVDEADFVKNDGKYIYIISGPTLVIVDAYPAREAKIVSKTPIKGQPVEMFVKGNRLVLFSTLQEEVLVKPEKSLSPVPYWHQVTRVNIYSITDRSNPILLYNTTISGTYYDARMIGNYIYLVSSEGATWYADEPVVPSIRLADGRIIHPDIYYFDIPEPYYVYHTISSFDITGDGDVEAESFLLGQTTTLYVSANNLYMAYQKTAPIYRWIEGAPVPLTLSEKEVQQRDRTIIHKFGISKGEVKYLGMGEVSGHLLNQFSMDEYNKNLRVATTVEGWTPTKSFQFNNVYVLDESMKTIGELEYIAPDERIYATRFIGDRLYMVTFKRIDPFFVIDLSDPLNPGILGKLKLPGFSDYLHPYDQNHIIGIGKETEENQWGGVSIAGLKLALFDVSDVNNPKLIDKVEIGEAGTDSEALNDHKAFLFDKNKNVLVIPVREIKKILLSSGKYPAYTQKIYQGAYVFAVSPEQGFTLRGTVTHNSDAESYYYWGSPEAVRRSLYMDDVLYTISSQVIVMSNLNNIDERINEVTLPYEWPSGIYPPIVK